MCALTLFATLAAAGAAIAQPPKSLPIQITPEAVRQTKQATVYLKVTGDSGQTLEGSGFFVSEPGLIVTNAHVLGMLRARSKPPKAIDVIVNSGETNELKLVGKLLGVDRTNDLAILRVEGKLPAPLKLELKDELVETQKVYIFGFPFGAELGKNITVSESSVSSLRKDASGALERIQVNGGMHPGNSGGPVVDASGRVVGVSVAVIRSTQINFAIPAVTVKALLDGGIQEVNAGELFRDKEAVRVPLQISSIDPFQRIKEIRVEVWAGRPDPNRAFSPKQAQPLTGDGPRQSQALKYENSAASADVLLPKVADGQVAWVQPVVVFTKGERLWGPPRAFDAALALQRIPAELTIKLADQKERTVHLKASQSFTLTRGKTKSVSVQTAELDLLESLSTDPKGMKVKIGFGPPSLTVDDDGKKMSAPPEVVNLLQRIPPSFVVDETNTIQLRTTVNLNPKMSPLVREQVDDYMMQIYNAYDASNYPMPNRQMQPRDSWQLKVPMMIKTGTKVEMVDLAVTCTYEGVRTRSGYGEALVSFEGRAQRRKATKDESGGSRVAGKFTFDTKAGFVSGAKMSIFTEDSSPDGSVHVLFALDFDMTRVEGNPRMIQLPKSATVAKKDDPKTDPKVEGKDPKAAAFTKPAKSTKPTSYMKIVSSPGDYIGQGKNYDYRGDQLTVKKTPRGLNIMVDGWILSIGAPKDKTLKVGEYPNAKRFAFSDDSPGLDFMGKGRGSNMISGEFVVWELETKGDQIVKLAIDFVQRGDGKPPLKGTIRINSSFE
jgi:S1-C subfamily serine protease